MARLLIARGKAKVLLTLPVLVMLHAETLAAAVIRTCDTGPDVNTVLIVVRHAIKPQELHV